MTVWAKLQSWIGAIASGTDLDNEFNNIYTGLNESQNGSRPSGYNDVRLTYSTDQLTVKGETKVNGVNVDLNSTITVSGATGWRYVVTTTGGVVSVETIPGGEITADTIVYSPNPTFNNTLNGYYSSVNTTRRIIGIIWYDTSTKILEAIPYGHGAKKNDDYWETNDVGISATSINTRLRFTGTWNKKRGQNIVCVDNGNTPPDEDISGFRITFLNNGIANIGLMLEGELAVIAMNKNGAAFKDRIGNFQSAGGSYTNLELPVQKDDYFTFYTATSAVGSQLSYMTISFTEL